MCPRLGRKQNAGCLLGFLRSIQRKNPTKIIAVSKRGVGLSGFLFIFECKTLFVQTGLRIAWVACRFAMRCACKMLWHCSAAPREPQVTLSHAFRCCMFCVQELQYMAGPHGMSFDESSQLQIAAGASTNHEARESWRIPGEPWQPHR